MYGLPLVITRKGVTKMSRQCIHCGREIQGACVTIPEGDAYHYACVDVSYPEPCDSSTALQYLEEVGTNKPTMRLFRYTKQNPYHPLNDEEDAISMPSVEMRIDGGEWFSVELWGRRLSLTKAGGEHTHDIAPLLWKAMYFGAALERDYPAYANRDRANPAGTSRVGGGDD